MLKHVVTSIVAWVLALALLAGCTGAGKAPAAGPDGAPAFAAACQLANETDREVVEWLRQSALPLNGVKAGAPPGDLQALKPILKDVQVVGLGEATHGSAEFFQMKHRLLEFLVTEMGYTVFAMEASYASGLAVNEYVLHGKGTPEKGLWALGFWIWQTTEVADMLRWMRSYNETAPLERQVRFVGFDIQVVDDADEWLGEYLGRTTPELWTPRADLLADVTRSDQLPTLRTDADATQVQADLQAFVADLEANRERLAAASSAAEAQIAINLARNVQRYHETYGIVPEADFIKTRDKYMAATFAELRGQLGPDTKMVLWGHNIHMSTQDGFMGSYLRQALGDRYYALGFAFGQGAFQAMGEQNGQQQEWTVGPAPEGFAERNMGCAANEQLRLFNFRRGARPAATETWLSQPTPFRQLGAVWNPEWDNRDQYLKWENRLTDYDGMIYVPVTKRADRIFMR